MILVLFGSKRTTNQGSLVQILPGAFFKGYQTQSWPSLLLPDRCRTFYPQLPGIRIRDAQHGARLLAIQHEVSLLKQAPDIGARVMARHRVVRMAEQHLSILG